MQIKSKWKMRGTLNIYVSRNFYCCHRGPIWCLFTFLTKAWTFTTPAWMQLPKWECTWESLGFIRCTLPHLWKCVSHLNTPSSLGLTTKAKGLQGCGPRGKPRVTSHAPGSAKSVREWTLTLPSELPLWELEFQIDSQIFRARL
jgi:hypothetical protein